MKSLNKYFFVSSSATAFWILAAFAPSASLAQPNPFDTYESDKEQLVASREAACQTKCPEPKPCPAQEVRGPSYVKGSKFLGARAAFNLNTSSNELLDGTRARNTTFIGRLSPSFGYMLRDNLEIGASLGYLGQRIQREDAPSTSSNVWLELSARYHIPISQRLDFSPELGLGGYLGVSKRPTDGTEAIPELTNTRGGSAAVYLNMGYALTHNVILNFDVHMLGLLGNESIESQSTTLPARALSSGLGLGIRYKF